MTRTLSMPKWSALVLTAVAAGCVAPAAVTSTEAGHLYVARGQEPGWALSVLADRIDYSGNYGETRITVPRPEPRTTLNGHRYETARLIVDVTHGRCNDVMSGFGFADQVMVIADGATYRGCGGERRPDWDA